MNTICWFWSYFKSIHFRQLFISVQNISGCMKNSKKADRTTPRGTSHSYINFLPSPVIIPPSAHAQWDGWGLQGDNWESCINTCSRKNICPSHKALFYRRCDVTGASRVGPQLRPRLILIGQFYSVGWVASSHLFLTSSSPCNPCGAQTRLIRSEFQFICFLLSQRLPRGPARGAGSISRSRPTNLRPVPRRGVV